LYYGMYREGKAGTMQYFTVVPSPVGVLTLACDESGTNLTGLWIEGQKHHGGAASEDEERGDMPVFFAAKNWLDRYFAGEKPCISELPLSPMGSGFRQGVWRALCEIPYGGLATYGEIAKKMAAKTSARAVGGAVAHNPISIIIPCHRVVGSNGSLTGYAAGLDKKIWLLELEGVGR